MNISVWTDGSCNWKNRLGGCAFYALKENNEEIFFQKGYKNTTIDRMEIMAIIYAIRSIKENEKVSCSLYCDRLQVTETLKTSILNIFLQENIKE